MTSTQKKKLRPVEDIIKRLRHDKSLGLSLDHVYITYTDGKYSEPQRKPFNEFVLIRDGGDIPMHKILYVGYDVILWDKETRLDRLCGSGETKPQEKWPFLIDHAEGDGKTEHSNENDEKRPSEKKRKKKPNRFEQEIELDITPWCW